MSEADDGLLLLSCRWCGWFELSRFDERVGLDPVGKIEEQSRSDVGKRKNSWRKAAELGLISPE